MTTTNLLESVHKLSSAALRIVIDKREAEDKALRTLLRAAIARERHERRQKKAVPA